MSILYNLPFEAFEDPKVKYFLKAVRINCPLKVSQKHVIDIVTLQCLISLVESFSNGITYKAMFLVSYFGFFCLSNLVPHAVKDFDPTCQFAGRDLIFTNSNVKMVLKWSKTIQNRDKVKVITLPRLDCPICPFLALQSVFQLFHPADMDPLFQCFTSKGIKVMTDSRVRKVLASLNQIMGLLKGFYSFHCFQRSGATLAYKNRVAIEDIQQYGTWMSDCVWHYISLDSQSSSRVASRFKNMLS